MKLFKSSPVLPSTPFSDFFRKASSREKKRVYESVLRRAAERQQNTIRKEKSVT